MAAVSLSTIGRTGPVHDEATHPLTPATASRRPRPYRRLSARPQWRRQDCAARCRRPTSSVEVARWSCRIGGAEESSLGCYRPSSAD